MVLASNEWLKNCDDGQKSAAAIATVPNTITNTVNNCATPPIGEQNNTTINSSTGVAKTVPPVPPNSSRNPKTGAIEKIPNDNANYEQNDKDQQKHNPKKRTQVVLPINYIKQLKTMAEQTTTPPSTPSTTITTITTGNTNDRHTQDINSDSIDSESVSIDNNNLESDITITARSGNITDDICNINSMVKNVSSGTTLQNKLISNPLTTQTLNTVLQTALNSTNGTSIGSNNMQNNFLQTLGIGGGGIGTAGGNNVAGSVNVSSGGIVIGNNLQQTAKQLNAALCALDTTVSNHSNISSCTSTISSGESNDLNNGQSKIILICETNSHPFQTRTILLTPNIECKVGRLIAKSKVSEANAIFDCKVLSRNHAVIWYTDDGKFWVKDTKSSNGTFINENKLGTDAAELHFGDIVKFGVDVLENSRKEVHGCIITCVKLYLPDGREAITIDGNNSRMLYSGETRITYDEMHRLNLYLQEAAQREKVLKAKFFNLQNLLDATRKNSASCWQSMIAEDQLLHRINSLEKKLQIMEKNVPESVLRNEVVKLLDDKTLYQHTAKEALRKVYQERCEAMQMLSKLEAEFTTSDNECKLLREQIMNTKQTLQDVNGRLVQMETEYNAYKEEVDMKLQEAKEKEEQHIAELAEKLNRSESECEELRQMVSGLLSKRQLSVEGGDEYEAQLQQQAFESLDAAIAGMDTGDDDEDDDDDDMLADVDVGDADMSKVEAKKDNTGAQKEQTNSHSIDAKYMRIKQSKTMPKQSTIMKWLQNSDLNKKAGSHDIFNAICNESDSSDEQDTHTFDGTAANIRNKSRTVDFDKHWLAFTENLESVQNQMAQLETELMALQIQPKASQPADAMAGAVEESDLNPVSRKVNADNDGDDKEATASATPPPATTNAEVFNNKSFMELKTSISMLQSAYKELCEDLKEQPSHCQLETVNLIAMNAKLSTPLPPISVSTQFQKFNSPQKPSNTAAKKLETQDTLKSLEEINEEHDSDDDDDEEVLSEATTQNSVTSAHTVKELKNIVTSPRGNIDMERQQQLEMEVRNQSHEIDELRTQLAQYENEASIVLEVMQDEFDTSKEKVVKMNKLIKSLQEENAALQQVIEENKSNSMKTAESLELMTTSETSTSPLIVDECPIIERAKKEVAAALAIASEIDDQVVQFNKETRDELEAINSSNVEREEELITYKERLDETLNDNIKLRQQIIELKNKPDNHVQRLVTQTLPLGIAVIAIFIYFVTTYF